MKKSVAGQRSVPFEITPRTIVLVLATIAAVWLAYQLWVVELILLLALILAGTFNPVIEWLEARGFHVMRIWNHEFFENPDAVLESIWRTLKDRATPLPEIREGRISTLPQGEG